MLKFLSDAFSEDRCVRIRGMAVGCSVS